MSLSKKIRDLIHTHPNIFLASIGSLTISYGAAMLFYYSPCVHGYQMGEQVAAAYVKSESCPSKEEFLNEAHDAIGKAFERNELTPVNLGETIGRFTHNVFNKCVYASYEQNCMERFSTHTSLDSRNTP